MGRIANMLYNKEAFTINPLICTVMGLIGGGLGSWVFSALPLGGSLLGGGLMYYSLQLASGIVLSALLLLMLLPFREKPEQDDF